MHSERHFTLDLAQVAGSDVELRCEAPVVPDESQRLGITSPRLGFRIAPDVKTQRGLGGRQLVHDLIDESLERIAQKVVDVWVVRVDALWKARSVGDSEQARVQIFDDAERVLFSLQADAVLVQQEVCVF